LLALPSFFNGLGQEMPQRVGQRCTIHNHAKVDAIDGAIAVGVSHRKIAEEFGVSHDAVARHAAHLTPERRLAMLEQLLARGSRKEILVEDVADDVASLKMSRRLLLPAFEKAITMGDWKAATAYARTAQENVAVHARLTGAIKPAAGTTINNNLTMIGPEIISAIQAMRPTPEQREAFGRIWRQTHPAVIEGFVAAGD
jgi:hypothetical protein